MIPSTLAIMMTYHCNFLCEHCSVSAGPNTNTVLPSYLMKKAIEQAYVVSTIRCIVFTGGESTLYLEQLKEGIAHASKMGFVTRLVSNAWWAKTLNNAIAFLGDLVKCGLNELNISYDDFHSPYLEQFGGENNICNAVKAATELGLTIIFGALIYKNAKVTNEYLRYLLSEKGIKGDIQYLEGFISPFGRAKEKLSSDYIIPYDDKTTYGACKEVGSTMLLLPEGNVLACCGHAVFSETQKLLLVDNISSNIQLWQIVERIQRNVLYWWFHLEGPSSVLKEIGIETKVNNICELCQCLAANWDKLNSLGNKKVEIFSQLKKQKSLYAEMQNCC